MDGQTILDALEFGVSKYPSSSSGFLQVSGISFDIDSSFNSTVLSDETGVFINITGKRRISNVKINGEDLILTKKYKTSLLEFMAIGGDGYSMLSNFEVTQEALLTDTDALFLYIKNSLNGEIPEKYSKLQGRINFKNETSKDGISEIKKNNNFYLPIFLFFSLLILLSFVIKILLFNFKINLKKYLIFFM